MFTIKLKPLSVNDAWQGKRFKTPAYKAYEWAVYTKLPPSIDIPTSGNLQIFLEFGFSSSASDFDNPIKPLVDILQKRYNFNDKRIKRARVDVVDVKKGDEYLSFRLSALN